MNKTSEVSSEKTRRKNIESQKVARKKILEYLYDKSYERPSYLASLKALKENTALDNSEINRALRYLKQEDLIHLTFDHLDMIKEEDFICKISPHGIKEVESWPTVKLPAEAPHPTPGLTTKQQADYDKFEYKSQDRLHIPGTIPQNKSNDIIVNGHEPCLGDSLFALLMRFVVELKKGKGGWVSTPDLMAEGFINDTMLHQPYSNLRSKLEGSLKEKDGQEFIESDGSKHYRLSTHPDFVTFDKKKLKTHPDPKILKLLKEG